MMKHAFKNALLALCYIVLVAFTMFYGTKMVTVEETILIPIAMLSLFVLSAAIMGYLFVYHPLRLYFEGEKKQALDLFLGTVAVFACLTVLVFLVLVSGVFF